MGLFSGIESSLEKYIEGFFKDKFSSDARVQPTDVAKKLARAMRDKRKVSVSNVYVPNEYVIYLHSSDYNNIKPMSLMLSKELSDYLIKKAEEKNFTLVSRPNIRFEELAEVEPGDIIVESNFGVGDIESQQHLELKQRNDAKEKNDVYEEHQDTRSYQSLSDTAPIPLLNQQTMAVLIVEEGNEVGREYGLSDYRTSLGRRDTCDIVLSDSGISRRHAQIEKIGGRFWVTDLNSTNGTSVNGLPIEKKELTSGDVITVGNTVLIFKEF